MNEERRTSKLNDVPAHWNRLTEAVIGAAMEVHSALGPGLLENALCRELELRGIRFVRQAPIRMSYKGVEIGDQFLDLLVEDILVLELKSVERVHDTHLATLFSYLRSGGYPLGLLINFNVPQLKQGLYRRVLSSGTPMPESFLNHELPPRSSAPSDTSAYS